MTRISQTKKSRNIKTEITIQDDSFDKFKDSMLIQEVTGIEPD